jgi:hypothetical protein
LRGQNFTAASTRQGQGFCFIENPLYFSWLDTLVNVVFKLVPIAFTAATITIEMPAAIRQYSMAVAPLSSSKKRLRRLLTLALTTAVARLR